jgi:hypothetical protein
MHGVSRSGERVIYERMGALDLRHFSEGRLTLDGFMES